MAKTTKPKPEEIKQLTLRMPKELHDRLWRHTQETKMALGPDSEKRVDVHSMILEAIQEKLERLA